MATESNANRKARELKTEINELLDNIILQHTFINQTIAPIIDHVLLPGYKSVINSTTNQNRKQRYINKSQSVLEYVIGIRNRYKELFDELEELKRTGKRANSVKDKLKQIVIEKQDEFDRLNFELNRFVKNINKSLPNSRIIRVTSQHTPLTHRINNFRFRERSRSRSPTRTTNITRNRNRYNNNNGTRRGRSRNRYNNNNGTSRGRSRSAIRNPSRGPRGSIHFMENARVVQTDPIGSRRKMTFLSSEISQMSREAKEQIIQQYGSIQAFKEAMANANRIAREAAE